MTEQAVRPHPIRVTVWWYRFLLGGLMLAFAGGFALMGAAADGPEDWVVLGSCMAISVLLAIRGFRSATVVVNEHALISRSFCRTPTFKRSAIQGITLARGSSAVLGGWRVPVLVLVDGRGVKLDEMRSWKSGELAEVLRRSLVDDDLSSSTGTVA